MSDIKPDGPNTRKSPGDSSAYINRIRNSNIPSEHREKAAELLLNILATHDELTALLEETGGCGFDNSMYKFYSQSFKVYRLQHTTQEIAAALRDLAPKGTKLNSFFEKIIQTGASGKEFDVEHNKEWTLHTQPIIEAFFQARYFLEAAVKVGSELETLKEFQGWGGRALLSLYNLWTY